MFMGPDSGTICKYFKIKVDFRVSILKSSLHQPLNLTYCYLVYIALRIDIKIAHFYLEPMVISNLIVPESEMTN